MQKVVIEKSYEIFAADLHTQKVYRNGISGAFPKPQWCDKTSLYVARKVLKILDLHEVYELEPYNGPRLSELPNRPHEGWHTPVLESAEAWRQCLQAPSSFAGSKTSLA